MNNNAVLNFIVERGPLKSRINPYGSASIFKRSSGYAISQRSGSYVK